jgi:hypothetical protein
MVWSLQSTPSEQAVSVSLRLLEIVALLLPVVAITVQLLFREYESDVAERTRAETAVFVATGFVFFLLLLVGANLITVVNRSIDNATVSDALTNLSTSFAILTLALIVFLYDFYRGEDDAEEAEEEDEEAEPEEPEAGEPRPRLRGDAGTPNRIERRNTVDRESDVE